MAKILASNHLWLIGILWNTDMALRDLYQAWRCHSHEHIKEDSFERKFYRWKGEIKDYYNIEIKYSAGLYHIENKNEIEKNSLKKWLFETALTHNELSDCISIKDRILPESVPSGNSNLTTIIGAMHNKRVIHIIYKKYSAYDKQKNNSINVETIDEYDLHPYCVKLFEKRWYVIGKCPTRNGEMRTFSLDMIQSIDFTGKTFRLPKDFDAEDYFKEYYGIVTGDNGPLDTIKIWIDNQRANYFRALKLHHSQKEAPEKDQIYKDGRVFTYRLRPANDFYQALLHHGSHLEVLSPESVRNKMKELIQEMAEKYSK